MTRQTTRTLSDLLAPGARQVEADLEAWLVEPAAPEALAEAMRYCALDGGKRLRPALVRLAALAAGADADDEITRRAAVAIELLHCYSLVHDDLPAMDDDVLRRGRPTAHVQFGEAMAILAGDALLTRAFMVLVESGHPASARLVAELARGGGCTGMIAGQVADMHLCDVPEGVDGLRYIHARKTGALICAGVRMGAICGGASPAALEAMTAYGESLGLAFQVIDDLLDVTASSAELGKTPGKDARAGKRTYVTELGLARAGELAGTLTRGAIESLAPLGGAGEDLAELARVLAQRTH